MTREEEILFELDDLAQSSAEFHGLKKRTKLTICIDVYNEAIDHNNDEAAKLLKELEGLRGKVR